MKNGLNIYIIILMVLIMSDILDTRDLDEELDALLEEKEDKEEVNVVISI